MQIIIMNLQNNYMNNIMQNIIQVQNLGLQNIATKFQNYGIMNTNLSIQIQIII